MGKVFDILMDDNNEDDVLNGDDRVGDATRQHSRLLIACEKGENKNHPDSGVGIATWILEDSDAFELKKEIQAELEADGQRIESLVLRSIDDIVLASTYGA